MSNPILELSTIVAPPKEFTVNGDVFRMLGINHLSPADEATAIALFSRHTILQIEVEATKNVQTGAQKAALLRTCRLQILCKLTDMPMSLAEQLPVDQQVKLLEALQREIESADADDEAADAALPEEDREPGVDD